jgi:multiple sugar transport system permease protein
MQGILSRMVRRNSTSVTGGLGERASRWVDRHLIAILIAPALILLVLLVIFPTLYLLVLSLLQWDFTAPDIKFVGLKNFIEILTDDSYFWEALFHSVIFVVCGVTVEYGLGLGLALLMNREMRGIGIFRTLLISPMAMTPIVTGMVWLILLNPTYGLLDYLLGLVGIHGPAWTAQPQFALPALILVDVWQWTPFMFLIMSAGLLSLPIEVLEAGRVDGASPWQQFWLITLPLLRRVSLVALLLRTIDIWKVFDTIFALTKGGPGTATQTINFYGYMQGFQWFHLGYAAALMVIAVVVVIIFTEIFVRLAGDLLVAE